MIHLSSPFDPKGHAKMEDIKLALGPSYFKKSRGRPKSVMRAVQKY
jgi:hypothetical protein